MQQTKISKRRTLFVRSIDAYTWKSTWLLKLAVSLSGTAMTALLTQRGSFLFMGIGIFCAFCAMFCLTFFFRLLERVLTECTWQKITAAAIFSILADIVFAKGFFLRYSQAIEGLASAFLPFSWRSAGSVCLCIVAALAALPAVFLFCYAFLSRFIPFAAQWIYKMDKIEKQYLFVSGTIFVLSTVVIFSLTNAFYGAVDMDGTFCGFDVIYTSDSGNQLQDDVYLNINAYENDLRQPLFGLFAMPFALAGKTVASLLFFLPNAYPIVLNSIQVLLLLLSFIAFSRILGLSGPAKGFFLSIITVLYPTLLFSLNMEQYIFAVFWLALFLESCLLRGGSQKYFYIAATGSMLTSGVLFPLLSLRCKNLSVRMKCFAGAFVRFLVTVTIFGQLPLFLGAIKSIRSFMRFTGVELGLYDRFLQFLNFAASCFIQPAAEVNKTLFRYASYQLVQVDAVSILGAAVLCLAAAGFVLNRKLLFAKVCFGWVSFSFLLLCIVGWGTGENGLVLYTLYFFWAYYALCFLLAEKVLAKWKKLRYILYSVLFVGIGAVNLIGVYNLIQFAMLYYPMR